MKREDVWDLTQQCGGVFKFTVLLQKRVQELVRGAPKLIDHPSNDPIEVAVNEIRAGVIELENLTEDEIEEMKKSLEEQAAAQSLLAKEQDGRPGDPSTAAITEFLKS
ncbi:MAG: DNA-directed RNA polymerase subunit omega [Planctomycetota bacterium JB042]